jgi:hypothetical protein
MATTLEAARDTYKASEAAFHATIAAEFPGLGETEWQRAHNHLDGTPFRRNDDTSNDVALAGSATIQAAWDAYIRDLHAFYALRDGPGGVLGGRGL